MEKGVSLYAEGLTEGNKALKRKEKNNIVILKL